MSERPSSSGIEGHGISALLAAADSSFELPSLCANIEKTTLVEPRIQSQSNENAFNTHDVDVLESVDEPKDHTDNVVNDDRNPLSDIATPTTASGATAQPSGDTDLAISVMRGIPALTLEDTHRVIRPADSRFHGAWLGPTGGGYFPIRQERTVAEIYALLDTRTRHSHFFGVFGGEQRIRACHGWTDTYVPSWFELATTSEYAQCHHLNSVLMRATPSAMHHDAAMGTRNSQDIVVRMFEGKFDSPIIEDRRLQPKIAQRAREVVLSIYADYGHAQEENDSADVMLFDIAADAWARWSSAISPLSPALGSKHFSIQHIRRILAGPGRSRQIRTAMCHNELGELLMHIQMMRVDPRNPLGIPAGEGNMRRLMATISFWIFMLTDDLYSTPIFRRNLPFDPKQTNTDSPRVRYENGVLRLIRFSSHTFDTVNIKRYCPELLAVWYACMIKTAIQLTHSITPDRDERIAARQVTSLAMLNRTLLGKLISLRRAEGTRSDWPYNLDPSAGNGWYGPSLKAAGKSLQNQVRKFTKDPALNPEIIKSHVMPLLDSRTLLPGAVRERVMSKVIDAYGLHTHGVELIREIVDELGIMA
ncbi:hypothetical protein J8273_6517 [Carpediemonas membranifera]|uniref:Uncharacterized protein n=1 Tax=Carpediemonas membranifera TaxID=201153 RepID=A0A8J6AQP9_9EUKA|nr:hypothetical protein J8273_6517 [Carpediemonas membranifera]|eukprot:KAG9391741.1 hypothetical protein J8273_6517 [Carpediemonas membranifera]